MPQGKQQLLQWIDDDRERLVDFLQNLIRCRTPNPPGDTRVAAEYVRKFLDTNELPYRIVAPNEEMPNIVATFDGAQLGRHLVLNGHIDVFPVGDAAAWTQDPWSGALINGKIFGRGACDMKCGTTASIFTYAYLHRLRADLRGKLTLTVVSDEETFGPWGARYLIDHEPDLLGDCCLNGEPTSPYGYRFGEKGPLWLIFSVRTPGAHGAYAHKSKSATAIAANLMGDLQALSDLEQDNLGNLAAHLDGAADVVDRAYGKGASKIIRKVTVTPTVIYGGVKVNMIPAECTFEVDIRVPIAMDGERILAEVNKIVGNYPEVTYSVLNYAPPNWSPPDEIMGKYIQQNAKIVSGIEPAAIIGLGGTDARLWRYKNIPAIVYGPSPNGMGTSDEYVTVEEFFHVVKTHVLSAYDYLSLKA
jgi:succinyl-diaminopimelate desuccinylase